MPASGEPRARGMSWSVTTATFGSNPGVRSRPMGAATAQGKGWGEGAGERLGGAEGEMGAAAPVSGAGGSWVAQVTPGAARDIPRCWQRCPGAPALLQGPSRAPSSSRSLSRTK